MTQDEIIEMARQAGFLYGKMGPLDMPFVTAIGHTFTVELEAFAKLVAEKATEEANARANARANTNAPQTTSRKQRTSQGTHREQKTAHITFRKHHMQKTPQWRMKRRYPWA